MIKWLAKKVATVLAPWLDDNLKALQADVTWRMRQLYQGGKKVVAEQLNLSRHVLTGYTLANDTPSAGSIQWSDVNVVYQGTSYGPYSGDTTDKYVYWDSGATGTLATSNTKPTIATDDALLFINDSGTAREALNHKGQPHGAFLIGQTVDSDEITDSAISNSKIAASAVDDTKISDVDGSKINADSVTSSELAASAVTNSELADGATSADKLNVLTHFLF